MVRPSKRSSIVAIKPAKPKRADPKTASMIPPPAPPRKSSKGAIDVTGRYVICPVSVILHEIRFCPIKETNGFWFSCPCAFEGKMPGTWTRESGYSHKEAAEYAGKCGGIVCGY